MITLSGYYIGEITPALVKSHNALRVETGMEVRDSMHLTDDARDVRS
jgi:hypothetical protein